jgi:hypothetical protein
MEAVPFDTMLDLFGKAEDTGGWNAGIEAVRARIIAAARDGQGEAVDWKIQAQNWESIAKVQQKGAVADKARAEKAEAELARIVAAAHEAGWNGVENSKDLAQFIKDLAQDADELEQRTIEQARKFIEVSALPQLRPIAEAGPVPDGCVRVYALYNKVAEKWMWLATHSPNTLFADLRLPDPAASQDGQPAPVWQPAVGDTVRLKSGGPVMTIGKVSDEIDVFCFRGDDLMKTSIPLVCLTPAKEKQ